MDRRTFLSLPAGAGLFGLRKGRLEANVSHETEPWPDRVWAEAIKRGNGYNMLKRMPPVHVVFLSPPEREGGDLRLDFINWDTYPESEPVLIPVLRGDPEWHVVGPTRYSVSLWMGPRPPGRNPSALIQFESPTRVSIYTHGDHIQQVVLLTGDSDT